MEHTRHATRPFRLFFLFAALLFAFPALAGKTLIVNANGYTISESGKVQRFATLLIGEDGRIVEILRKGKREPKLAEGDYRLDAEGRTLLPGLIDSHGHIVRLGLSLRGKTDGDASAGERERALVAALDHLMAQGITGVHDMGTTAADWALFRAFADDGRLNLRITAYAEGMPAMEAISPLRPTRWLYQDRLRLQGIKIRLDGELDAHAAWLMAPYADRPDFSGAPLVNETQTNNLFSRANYFSYQLAIHAAGDAALARALDSLAEIHPAYGGKYRNRIEHVSLIDAAQLPRFDKLDTIVSVQPALAEAGRARAATLLGPERAGRMHPWQSLLKADAPYALGSDFPFAPVNPFQGMQAAISRPVEGLTLAQALAGFTRAAAHAGHMEEHVGSIEAGKWADFIFVDRDPFAIPPAEIHTIRVRETWLAGRRIWQAKD